jgi:hypothetical protein
MKHFPRILIALLLFGISFGYVEATVVVYLRALYEPIHERLYPERSAGDLFPLMPLDRLQAEEPRAPRWLGIELIREAATLVMLAAIALAAASNARQWFAAFLAAFGLWDLFFYVFLKVLLDWPASWFTWDLLFLIPVPWVGPVLAPVLVALSMAGAGLWVLWWEDRGLIFRISQVQRAAIVIGGIILITAFCWDFRNTSAGGSPNPFNWPLFAVGEAIGLAGFLQACRTSAAAPLSV